MTIFLCLLVLVVVLLILSKISIINKSLLGIRSEIMDIKKNQQKMHIAEVEGTPVKETPKVVEKVENHQKYMPNENKVEPEVKEEIKATEEEVEKIITEEVKAPIETEKVKDTEKANLSDNWGYWTANEQVKTNDVKVSLKETITSLENEVVVKETVEVEKEPIKTPPKKPRKPEPVKFDFERFFGENLLSKIGIVTLVLGIAYFIKYAIDQNWINEIARVGIGFLVGAIIIGVAHKIKKQNDTFSAILVGGGIAVLYITTVFAYQEYELIPQTLAFVIMIIITAFSVLLSLLYDKKELAIFSLIGGFASPLLVSSGGGNYIVLFTYILILNSGMLVVAHHKRWHIVGNIAYALTILFLWGWIMKCKEEDKIGTVIFSFLFFVQFYALSIINYLKSEKMTAMQAIMILASNLSFFASCVILLDEKYRGIISISLALINAIPLVVLYKREKVDTNLIFLLIAVVLSFISLAVPLQLSGRVITLFWSIETCILLMLWIKSKQKVFGIGFIIIYVLAIGSWLMDLEAASYIYGDVACKFNINVQQFVTGLVLVAATFVNYFMLTKCEDEYLALGKSKIKTSVFANVMFNLFVALLFVVPFIELWRASSYYSANVQTIYLVAYTYVFMAISAVVNWKTKNEFFFALSMVAVIAFPLTLFSNLRYDIYSGEQVILPVIIHYVSIVALGVLCKYLIDYKKKGMVDLLYWIISIVAMIVLAEEAKTLAVIIFGNETNYYHVMSIVRTAVYPVVWGIMALVLIMWGIKNKIPTLRKIALCILGLVILKLYIIDIWRMVPTGRIIAFIVLGIVLLFSSFLVQRVKKLISKEELESENKDENETI